MISMQRERGVIIASSNNNTAYNFKIIVIYLEIVILLSFKILSHCAFTLDDEPLDTIDAFTLNGEYMRVRV